MFNPTIDAALAYAARDWPVLPLKGKVPSTRHGVKDARTDATWIRNRFAGNPNVGIATGTTSGLVVLDIDPRNGGDKALMDLCAKNGPFPETRAVQTGGGGRHFYFRHPGWKLKGMLGPGIDVKADGGYVVAPPSLHPETGEPYVWTREAEPAPLPTWILERLRIEKGHEASGRIPDGTRNVTLTSHAGKLKREGKTQDEIIEKLSQINEQECGPPLPQAEVNKIAESIDSYSNEESRKTRWQKMVARYDKKKLTVTKKSILLSLSVCYMDVDGKDAYPAQETLAAEIGASRTTVDAAINKALDLGILRHYRRPKPKNSPGKRKWSWAYEAVLPEDAPA